jgi:hypothetical protein
MSKLFEELDRALIEGIPKAKRPEPPKADVIPLPKGQALAVAKSERTSAQSISRVFDREKAAERERLRRAEAYLNSPAYLAAGERFNASLAREREENWFDPSQPFGFRR